MAGRFWRTLIACSTAALCAPNLAAQSGAGAAAADAVTAPLVATPVSEGMRTVSGIKGPGATPHSVEVMVRTTGETLPIAGSSYVQRAVTRTINDDGSFAVSLASPVLAGQWVVVCARGADDVDVIDGCHTPIGVETPDDWGRVRAYFAAGVVFSQERDSFSQQDPALSFTLDKTWWMRPRAGGWAPQAFNTFFDMRVTSIPVDQGTATTTASAAGSTAAETTSQQFINSRKAAMMQAGFYIPSFHRSWVWTHGNRPNAVFIAPVAKFGISTTTSGGAGVYTFYAIGFGVGHERLSGSSDSAPEMISYLHTTFGKWENFSASAWRMGFEGRLKIPSAPFQVGFDANVPFHAGPSDLRFIVGTRFDIGDLLGKLKPF